MIQGSGSAETPVETLFDGADLRVRAGTEFPGDTLLITFSSRSERGRGKFRPEGFGERFLRKERVPHVCFINKANHWWQTAEFATALDALRDSGLLSRFRRVVTYGASMGAYGALLAADRLDADLCLAFSPQFRLDDTLPLVPTWRADLRPWPIVAEPFEAASQSTRAEIVVFFDNLHALDRAHAEALAIIRPCRFVLAPGATHSVALYLHEAGLLKDIVRDAVTGEFDARVTRRRLRDSRRTDPRYWKGLGGALSRHRRPEAALRAHFRSVDLALENPTDFGDFLHDQVKTTLNATLAANRRDEAARLVARYREALPLDSRTHVMASRLERARGRKKAAVREAKQGVALAPHSGDAVLALAVALAGAARIEASRRSLADAVRLKGATIAEWIEAALVFKDADMWDEARTAVQCGLRIKPNHARALALAGQFETRSAMRTEAMLVQAGTKVG